MIKILFSIERWSFPGGKKVKLIVQNASGTQGTWHSEYKFGGCVYTWIAYSGFPLGAREKKIKVSQCQVHIYVVWSATQFPVVLP